MKMFKWVRYAGFLWMALVLSTGASAQVGGQGNSNGNSDEKLKKEEVGNVHDGVNPTKFTVKRKLKNKKNKTGNLSPDRQESEESSDDRNVATEPAVIAKEPIKADPNFDFIPGEQVVFYEDFSGDKAGDFPENWKSVGNGKVVTLSKFTGKWLQGNNKSAYVFDLRKPLQEDFTMEMDVTPDIGEIQPAGFFFYFIGKKKGEALNENVPGKGGFRIGINAGQVTLSGYLDKHVTNTGTSVERNYIGQGNGKIIKVSLWVQQQRIRLYINRDKVLDVEQAFPAGIKLDRLRIDPILAKGNNLYFSNIKISEGKRQKAEGRKEE
ncbi:MAG: hypothetical protein NTU44_05340 [Bacteroidetes bacterium]|nr:hypothetical protein [Bacteroidota bacterium]